MRILVTGGAGFIGSSLAFFFKNYKGGCEVIALDNLKRRGSELNLTRLREAGVLFVHGDIRCREDLAQVGRVDLLLECSAEPSVMAGCDGATAYVVNTNLFGTVNCLEFAGESRADVIFLSTSRVYPIEGLRGLPLVETDSRLDLPDGASGIGWSVEGITTDFPVIGGTRSLYGATKLCSEMLIAEYAALYGIRTVVNRCGVISGPWQMGKVDQGFPVLWCSRHAYGGRLAYKGFGGTGLQVRDVLHVRDLCDLVALQHDQMDRYNGKVFNVGGGRGCSVSLREFTEMCREASGNRFNMGSEPETHETDVPFYVTDNSAVTAATGWQPRSSPADIVDDIFRWLRDEEHRLTGVLG